jgi:DNA helicase IV
LKLAASKHLNETEYISLYRPRLDDVHNVRWTDNDVALLDEARSYLGSKTTRNNQGQNGNAPGQPDNDEIRTYGHIVVDEVQDLTPMQLRMVSRRSLNGSMTVVGDIAQATGALAPDDWADVLRYLPEHKPSRVIGLSVGYRIPTQIMTLANQVMLAATPTLRAPTSVRQSDELPEFVPSDPGHLLTDVAEATRKLTNEITDGTIAVVAPDSMVERVSQALDSAGIDHARATRTGLELGVTVVPVSVVKGLELDGVVVVEPANIVAEEQQGLRALYVALTRSTRRLTIVYSGDLPPSMQLLDTPEPAR